MRDVEIIGLCRLIEGECSVGDLAAADGSIPAVDAELPDILLGRAPARREAGDVVFAYNSGMVVTDVALGRYLADLALGRNRGRRVTLW